MRHYIDILRRVPHDDANDFAEQPEQWERYTFAQAEVSQMGGKELVNAREVHSEVTTKIKIKPQPGITAAMRCQKGSRTFEIVAVIDDDNHATDLVLMSKEIK